MSNCVVSEPSLSNKGAKGMSNGLGWLSETLLAAVFLVELLGGIHRQSLEPDNLWQPEQQITPHKWMKTVMQPQYSTTEYHKYSAMKHSYLKILVTETILDFYAVTQKL